MTSLLTSSARRSSLDRIDRAASSSRQPVETSQTIPSPSRNFAVNVRVSSRMRVEPSFPVVTLAVRARPLEGFQRANCWPCFVNNSAPLGSGRETVFLKTVPISFPFLLRLDAGPRSNTSSQPHSTLQGAFDILLARPLTRTLPSLRGERARVSPTPDFESPVPITKPLLSRAPIRNERPACRRSRAASSAIR